MPHPTAEEIAAARASLDIPDENFPRSIAIIMDGNGRWARKRNMPRFLGHHQGAQTVRRIITEAVRLGMENLTLYSFSQQNWSRPKEEIDALMHLYAEYLISERPVIIDNNIRLKHLGQREDLPEMVLKELDESVRVSQNNTGMILCLALNYGSREEILQAVRKLAGRVRQGEIKPEEITEEAFANTLDTAGVPDPDLLIRTAGEMRISNYLLWQLSYSEFYVTDTYWPDFDENEFHKAVIAYANRHRRFGGVDESNA
jgi:undecaprenyl diphosphate synthase